MNRPTWDQYFIELCNVIKKRSKDTLTKVGAVIIDEKNAIVSTGYNGFPPGIDDDVPERYKRPLKYFYFEHAERNAIYGAKRDLEGCTLYVSWHPCADCARAIIRSGIKRVVLETKDIPERWAENCNAAAEMLIEAGIAVRRVK